MGVKDHPQCYFDVELNREPGKSLTSSLSSWSGVKTNCFLQNGYLFKYFYLVFVVGRIVFQLFSEICPKTCKNFLSLCTGEFCFLFSVSICEMCADEVWTVENITGN